jgi:hypothetical protein
MSSSWPTPETLDVFGLIWGADPLAIRETAVLWQYIGRAGLKLTVVWGRLAVKRQYFGRAGARPKAYLFGEAGRETKKKMS